MITGGERLRGIESRAVPRSELLMAQLLSLTGLCGAWGMAAFDGAGNAQDQSGHGHHLGYNGNPTYNYANLAPYITLDGVGDYLARADEADLDILGTESYVAAGARGLTMGGWFYFGNAAAAIETCMGKWNAAANMAYRIYRSAAGLGVFEVSITGAAAVQVTGPAIAQGVWVWLAGRFVPSVSLDLWVNGTLTSVVAGVPASIFNSNADFRIGANGAGTELLTGRSSMCFLCAGALSSQNPSAIYQQGRPLFGV